MSLWMTLEQLRIFVAVADRLNMTQAAGALHLTQSAVSAAIAALETAHATRLFERVGRGLELSEAGEALLPEARSVLAGAAAASRLLDDLSSLRRGHLRIAASQTIANYWLPQRLAVFAQAQPAIRLDVTVSNTAQVAAAVLEGTAELGFVEGVVHEDLLLPRTVGGDRLGIFAKPDSAFGRRRPKAADLQEAAWALREPGSGTRSAFDYAMIGAGVDPRTLRIVMELRSNEALLAAVAGGGLMTAVSQLAAAPHVAARQVRQLNHAMPGRAFDLLTHRQRRTSRAAAAFIEAL